MASGYSDALRRTVEVLIQTGGNGDVDALRNIIAQLNAELVNMAKTGREAGMPLDELAGVMRQIAGDAQRVTAIMKEFEGQERKTAEAAAQAAGDALRAKIDAYARAERAAEQAAEAEKSAAGDALRAKIDAAARAERAAEQAAKAEAAAYQQAMQIVREVEGQAMRERAEAHARAERAAEAEAASAVRAANQIAEADAGIARAQAQAAMAAEEHARKLDAEGGRAEWVTRQIIGLDSALTAMAAHEAAAPRAGTADLMGVGAAQRERIEALAAAERGTRQWADSMERLREKFGPTGNAASQFGRQLLFVSYAAQDLYQGGFSAILNNIPQLAMAFGAPMPVMAGLAIGALGLDVAFKTLGPAARELAVQLGLIDSPTATLVTNVDQAKAKIEALTSRPWKLDVDYRNIEDAKKALDVLQKAMSAYESGRIDAAQRDLGGQAKDVTSKFLGGTEGLGDKILAGADAGKFDLGLPTGDDETSVIYRRDAARLKHLEEAIANPDTMLNPDDAFAVRNAQAEAAAIREKMRQGRIGLAKVAAGKFDLGDEATVKKVQALAQSSPDLFGHVGPGGKTGARAIGDLPADKAEAERRAEVLRSAHEAIADAQTDEDVTPGEKMQTIADQVNRLASIPGEAGRKAHEAAKRALAAARKAYEHEVKGAEDEAEKMGKELDRDLAKGLNVPEVDDATNLAAWNRAGQERAHNLRNRLSELVMHKDEPAAERQAGIKEVLDEIEAHRVALKDKDIADLKLAADRASRQIAGQAQAGANRADHAAEAASKKLGPAFEKQIQAETLLNQLNIDAAKRMGLPVSSTMAEFESNRQMGNMAVTPELMKGMHAQAVGVDLQRAGANPALAGRVVQHATDKLAPMMAKASAQMGTTMDDVIDNQAITAQVLQGLMNDMAQVQARANGVNGTLRNLRRRGPSGWPANK